MTIRYLNYPKVPESLYLEIPRILSAKNDMPRYTNIEEYPPMQAYLITGPLFEWIQTNIPIIIGDSCHINHISDTIDIHQDFQKDRYKVNYLFKTGGPEVKLNFFDENKQFTHYEIVESQRWYTFDSKIYHNVSNLSPGQKRIGITIATSDNPML